MGRAMSLPGDSAQLANLPSPVTIFNPKLNRYYQVSREGNAFYQSEYEPGPGGTNVFKTTHKLEYVIGSGVNGYGYIVSRGDYLFEAPLSYYVKPQTLDLSPGYQSFDFGFNRVV